MSNRILGITDFLLFSMIFLISAFGLILLYSATNQVEFLTPSIVTILRLMFVYHGSSYVFNQYK